MHLNIEEEFQHLEAFKMQCLGSFNKASQQPFNTEEAAVNFISYARNVDKQMKLAAQNSALTIDHKKEFDQMEAGKSWALQEFERVRKFSHNLSLTALCSDSYNIAVDTQLKLISKI
jgi:hypothetical protein